MKIELNKTYYIARGKKVGTLVIDSVGAGVAFYREHLNGKSSLVKSCPTKELKSKLETWVQANATWYGDKDTTDETRLLQASRSFGVPADTLSIRLTKAPASKANNGAYKHMVLVPSLHKDKELLS